MKVQFYKEENFKVAEDGFGFEVPEDWEVVRLGNKDVAEIIMGQSPPSSTYNDVGKGLPFLQGKAEFGDIYPSPSLYCSKPIKIAELNDILLSVRAPVGDVNLAPFKCCIGRGLAAIRPKNGKLNYLFLFYYLKFNSKTFETISSGSTFKAIRKIDIENYLIPLPPLEEQQKIAHVLVSIDKAIEAVDEAIAKAERIKKGLMQELLTKGIGHKEFKRVELNGFKVEIPKEWEVVRLENVMNFENGKRPRIILKEGRTPIYGAGGVMGYTDEFMVNQDFTIVVARVGVGSVGKVYLARGKVWISDNAIYSQNYNQTKVYPPYIFYLLVFKRLDRFISRSGAGGYAIITQSSLRNIKIPLPPLEEQRKIAEILSKWDEVIETKKAKKEKLERMKKKVMELLLTGKVRVK